MVKEWCVRNPFFLEPRFRLLFCLVFFLLDEMDIDVNAVRIKGKHKGKNTYFQKPRVDAININVFAAVGSKRTFVDIAV